jgi:hypothetical protein
MTGRAYYLTTLGAWRRHAGRLANSHWVALESRAGSKPGAQSSGADESSVNKAGVREGTKSTDPTDASAAAIVETTVILGLVEADEGAHLALQDDPDFEMLPHPFAPQSISAAVQNLLSAYGVAPGATTFDAAEALARVHPLLRHRVF